MAKKAKGKRGIRSGPLPNTKEVQETFLSAFVKGGTIRLASLEANVSRHAHYDWLKTDADYREKFYEAEEDSADVLEEEARRRAHDGVDEPVGFYLGEHGGTFVTKYSDGLLRFLLEGRRASVFKHRHEVTGAGGGPLMVTQIERVIVDPADDEEEDAA